MFVTLARVPCGCNGVEGEMSEKKRVRRLLRRRRRERHVLRLYESWCAADDACGTCGGTLRVCSCGWMGCLAEGGDEAEFHRLLHERAS